jgi:membrane protease YdiL (CAAX protease family)
MTPVLSLTVTCSAGDLVYHVGAMLCRGKAHEFQDRVTPAKEMTMEITEPPLRSDDFRRIAHPIHTVLVILVIGATALRTAMHADQTRATANLDRLRMYERTMLIEWITLAVVLLGVAFARVPLTTVLGERWHSLRSVARDLGIGIAYSFVSTMILSIFGSLLHSTQTDRNVQFLLPHDRLEMTVWVVLSVSAGICEEAVYRGYLQRQFIAFTRNVPAGILFSAVLFGLAHSYQGFWGAMTIVVDGALLGVLAYWRKSVRPGMIAHAWKDAWAPLLMSLPKH